MSLTAEVTRKQKFLAKKFDQQESGSKNVTAVHKGYEGLFRDLNAFVKSMRFESSYRFHRIGFGIKRFRWVVLRETLFGRPSGVFGLYAA